MPSSDSEDFESADEGSHDGIEKKERKKHLSSSNDTDRAPDCKSEPKRIEAIATDSSEPKNEIIESSDGWDDFDIEVKEPTDSKQNDTTENILSSIENKSERKQQDSGWDEFDDWGDDSTKSKEVESAAAQSTVSTQDIKSIADRLSSTSVTEKKASSGWGWGGWGVDSFITSATAGISSITNQVSQGISTVLETGIGAPDPEELARKNQLVKGADAKLNTSNDNASELVDKPDIVEQPKTSPSDGAFPFGSLFSGVTKFVETTGTKVIAGGLDTLETIGKKTMEVLQDGDPGLAKKRAMLGLDAGDKVVLSQVLREAKAKADEEDSIREQKKEAKEVHYETLFDDFEGLVHLEALEMLSKQVNMRIEEQLRNAATDKRQEIKETLQQVAELCEMPDEDDDEESENTSANPDSFHECLQEATQDLSLKLQFQPLVKQYTEVLDWLENTNEELTEKIVYKRAVSGLAHCTALCMELYHKSAEMLLVKPRRSTADEADALTQMTVVLTRHISDVATKFTEKINSLPVENKDQINTYITNIFLEAGNSSTYIQNAFQLALPILQIGAA